MDRKPRENRDYGVQESVDEYDGLRAARNEYGNVAEEARPGRQTLVESTAMLALDALPGHARPSSIPQPVKTTLREDQGSPLPDGGRWSGEVGADVSHARVVTGPRAEHAAASIGARAFTVGERVFFGAGTFAPDSEAGGSLLRHELTHVAQQRGASMPDVDNLRISSPSDSVEHEARGNAGGGSAVSGGETMIARDGEGDRLQPSQYFRERHIEIGMYVSEAIGRTVHFDTTVDYCHWLNGAADAVIGATVRALTEAGFAAWMTVTEGEVLDALNRGRDADAHGGGPNVWHAEVARELRAIIIQPIQESLRRMAPRYAVAFMQTRHQLWEEGRATAVPLHETHVAPGLLVGSLPMDRYLIVGLCQGRQLIVDPERYTAAGVAGTAGPRELREVTDFRFESPTWVRINAPANPTREEAAAFLFGESTSTQMVVPAAPRFGFSPSDIRRDLHERWRSDTGSSIPAGQPGGPGSDTLPAADPALEAMRGHDDQPALTQADAFLPTGANPPEIVERLGQCLALIEDIQTYADLDVPSLRPLDLVRTRITERRTHLQASTDPAEVRRWDAQSAAQLNFLRQAANGVRVAGEQIRRFRGDTATGPSGSPAQIPDYVREPLNTMFREYHNAAVFSELADTAQLYLTSARHQEQLYPIDMAEGILRFCRETLRSAVSGPSAGTYHIDDLTTQEQQLRERVFGAREELARDPSRAQQLITEVMRDVSDLQDRVQMLGTMTEIDRQWDWLHTHHSGLAADLLGQSSTYLHSQQVLEQWHGRFYEVYLMFRFPVPVGPEGMERARAAMATLRGQSSELQQAFDNIRRTVEDEEEKEKWLSLGLKIGALIGISVITMGVGAYVEAGLLVGAGWGMTAAGTAATGVLVAGAEAATFTVLSNLILEENPTVRGMLTQFMQNWLMFGAMRGLSTGVRALMGAEMAATMGGRIAEATVSLSASMATAMFERDRASRAAGGQGLTQEQATEIGIETVAVFIGTMVAARCGAGALERIQSSAVQAPWSARLGEVTGSRVTLREAATIMSQTRGAAGGSPAERAARARDLLSRDSDTIRAEEQVIREVADWAAEHPTLAAGSLHMSPGQLAELRDAYRGVADSRARAALIMELESIGGNTFSCEGGRFDSIVQRFRDLGDRVEVTGEGAARRAVVTQADGPPVRISPRAGGDVVTAAPQAAGTRPATGEGGPQIRAVDPAQLTDGQRAVERWQTHGLETDPRAAPLMADPQFREWYARWMEMPDRFRPGPGGRLEVNPPAGCPAEIAAQLRTVAQAGNVQMMTRATDIATRLEAEFPQVREMDPTSPQYQAVRERLMERFGRQEVISYEQARGTRMVEGSALTVRIESVVSESALQALRAAFPDCEVRLTGSISQTGRPVAQITDVDVVIVAPQGTRFADRVAMEQRANAMRLQTTQEFSSQTGRGALEIDAKVLTPGEFFGLASMQAGGRSRLRYVDIGHGEPEGATGSGTGGTTAPTGGPRQPTPEEAEAMRWADGLAQSAPEEARDPARIAAEQQAYQQRQAEIRRLYEQVMRGEIEPPAGVTRERLRAAVEGDPVTGERIPLTFPDQRTYHQFQAELRDLLAAQGISDATVQQVGSATQGWRGNPRKELGPWRPTSDADFALFSAQGLVQAREAGAVPNERIVLGGRFTVLRNGEGFERTPLGRALQSFSRRWNQRVYGSPGADGFDFKLNLTTQPFGSAITVVQQ